MTLEKLTKRQLVILVRQLSDEVRVWRKLVGGASGGPEGIAEEIRKAKSQAWQACLLAHMELAATGDISVLDDPYEVGESA